ncbi:hypothetical protein FIM50_07075, partial [Helicobacter pylori]
MIFIQLFAYTLKINLKTLRYNFFTFSLRDFMQDSFTQSSLLSPPPTKPQPPTNNTTKTKTKTYTRLTHTNHTQQNQHTPTKQPTPTTT